MMLRVYSYFSCREFLVGWCCCGRGRVEGCDCADQPPQARCGRSWSIRGSLRPRPFESPRYAPGFCSSCSSLGVIGVCTAWWAVGLSAALREKISLLVGAPERTGWLASTRGGGASPHCAHTVDVGCVGRSPCARSACSLPTPGRPSDLRLQVTNARPSRTGQREARRRGECESRSGRSNRIGLDGATRATRTRRGRSIVSWVS